MADNTTDEDLRQLFGATRTIALVGASDKPSRDSHHVMRFLLGRGFDVYPVNPLLAGKQIHGRNVVANLSDVPAPIDMVDIFRRADQVAPIVDEAVAVGAKSIWMQLGVVDEASAAKARAAGLTVVMDRCPAIDMPRLGL